MTNVKKIDDQALVKKAKFLVAEETKNVSAQIVLLKEIKHRRLALRLGFSSLVDFCVKELGLTKDQAWKRSQAASVITKDPDFLRMLATQQTSISALAALSSKLTDDTAQEIKKFTPGSSKQEVEAFVSNLNLDGTREKKKQTVRLVLHVELATLEKLSRTRKLLGENKGNISREHVIGAALEALLDRVDPVRKAMRAERRLQKKAAKKIAKKSVPTEASVAPTAPSQSVASGAPTAPSQSVASGASTAAQTRARYIPANIRHKLHGAEEYRCAFVSVNGRQCGGNINLQIDHIKMFCHGGGHELENLRLLCGVHNRLLAERQLGCLV